MNTGNIFDDDGDGKELLTSDYVTQELLRQLKTWRQHLPLELAWDDEDLEKQAKGIVHNGEGQDTSLKYSNDVPDMKSVLAAALQTRYKYAHYMLWRPYIYRFLHSQKPLTGYDLQCCQKALNASSILVVFYTLLLTKSTGLFDVANYIPRVQHAETPNTPPVRIQSLVSPQDPIHKANSITHSSAASSVSSPLCICVNPNDRPCTLLWYSRILKWCTLVMACSSTGYETCRSCTPLLTGVGRL